MRHGLPGVFRGVFLQGNETGSALRFERRHYRSSATNPHVRAVSICRNELLSIESYFQTN